MVWAVVLAAGFAVDGCAARDCSEERAGQVRCVSNRVELCEDDGTLTYTSCAAQGLVCSEKHGGCVSSDVANATSSGGSSGDGGSPASGGGGSG
jgi:hypothetical protein